MTISENFHSAYRMLEKRMKALAEADRDVFLPNPEPEGPVDYVFICMEPSLGRWARSADQGRAKVESGFRNFLPSDDVALLHFSIRRYLCRSDEHYHLTDFSKGAMLVHRAGLTRVQRYERWYELLEEELDLVAMPTARIFAVGRHVAEQLKRRGFRRPITSVIHYSSQAGLARSQGIKGHEERFQNFSASVSLDDVVAVAKDVLASARVPDGIRDETMTLLKRLQFTPSRRKLIFNYKRAFDR